MPAAILTVIDMAWHRPHVNERHQREQQYRGTAYVIRAAQNIRAPCYPHPVSCRAGDLHPEHRDQQSRAVPGKPL